MQIKMLHNWFASLAVILAVYNHSLQRRPRRLSSTAKDTAMEVSLLLSDYSREQQRRSRNSSSSSSSCLTWGSFFEEVKRLGCIAGPMVAVVLSHFMLRFISVTMVGHLGELALSSSSIAFSLAGITGFSLFTGVASALETLCGQAYGAEQYQKLGLETYTAIFSLNLVCLPLSLIWIYMEEILIFTGQDPVISHEAGKFIIWLIPALFAYATLQPLVRILATKTIYAIPTGFGGAVSTRVSNELGAGNPQGARIATFAAMFLAVLNASIIITILFACRKAFGYTFSNEKEVIDYITTMVPLLCLSVILDSMYGVLSGIVRGTGWQHIGAWVNLGAFYLCGIPVAIALAFWLQLRRRGLWIGIQVGTFGQVSLLSLVTICANWEKQASNARERIFEGRPPEVNGLCDKAESSEC
nr:protein DETOXIFICATION 12-like isoform X3 [Malus domestica]